MSVQELNSWYATPYQVDYLKDRFASWCAAGMPNCDVNIKQLLVRINKHPEVVSAFSCEGHMDEDLSRGYFLLAASSHAGYDWLARVFRYMQTHTTDKYLLCLMVWNQSYSYLPMQNRADPDDPDVYPSIMIECDYNEDYHKDEFLTLIHQAVEQVPF